MAKRSLSRQLDDLISAALNAQEGGAAQPAPGATEPRLAALVRLAHNLCDLPSENFKTRLREELERRTTMTTGSAAVQQGKTKPGAKGGSAAIPYLILHNAAEALEFYRRAFGATELSRFSQPDGRIGHAEIRIGDSQIFVADEFPELGIRGPQSVGGSSVIVHLYVEDVDAVARLAVESGARTIFPVEDREYGDRDCRLEDPFGQLWIVSTHLGSRPIPEDYHTATPRLIVHDAAGAIEFYKNALGARELMRVAMPDGKIVHAEVQVGAARLMLVDEFPEWGNLSPQSLGGSSMIIHLDVEDVDATATRMVDAGATVVRPVQDEFYGDRSGKLADPYGHIWIVSTHKEDIPEQEIRRRLEQMGKTKSRPVASIREGFHTITAYLRIRRAAELVEFVKQAFGATETRRRTESGGIVHFELRLGDSMIMVGGTENMPGPEMPTALHIFPGEVDSFYRRALDAGASPMQPPADQEYGERVAGVKDPFGNEWYISQPLPGSNFAEGLREVNVYLHPHDASPFIDFLKNSFGAEEIVSYKSPQGAILHARVRIGDSILEMGDAHGPYQFLPTSIYLSVNDADAAYQQSLDAGAVSVQPPRDQPYGDRTALVKDPFGNEWCLTTHIADSE
jgi:PhnB protein